jgi:hypothetical protein
MPIDTIPPSWAFRDVADWQPPTNTSPWRTQVVGVRNDGQSFYMNVAAAPSSTETERAHIAGRALVEFDRRFLTMETLANVPVPRNLQTSHTKEHPR